jgi:hypothetical protein
MVNRTAGRRTHRVSFAVAAKDTIQPNCWNMTAKRMAGNPRGAPPTVFGRHDSVSPIRGRPRTGEKLGPRLQGHKPER